jgi:acyl carrier protein
MEKTTNDRFETVRQLISVAFNVPEEQIGEETVQADVATWDSLGHLNLMLMLEDQFSVSLDVDDMAKLTSVSAILEFLNARCPSS